MPSSSLLHVSRLFPHFHLNLCVRLRLVSTNCVKAPSSAFFSPFQSSSSSSTCSSIVRTSGNLGKCRYADVIFQPEFFFHLCLKYFIYSAAINGLYFTELCACDRSSYNKDINFPAVRIRLQKCPGWMFQKLSFFGILMFTSR